MSVFRATLFALLVTACARLPNSGQNDIKASSPYPSLSYQELMHLQLDCSQREKQMGLLEAQLQSKQFYRVNGIDGNLSRDHVDKRFYSLAKFRIWALRLGCQGGEVSHSSTLGMQNLIPKEAPLEVPRCYFEDVTQTNFSLSGKSQNELMQQLSRREICTNYPLNGGDDLTPHDGNGYVHIGDRLKIKKLSATGDGGISPIRRWRGNLYQMQFRTEIHSNQVMRFTVITAHEVANQWVVIDKF